LFVGWHGKEKETAKETPIKVKSQGHEKVGYQYFRGPV